MPTLLKMYSFFFTDFGPALIEHVLLEAGFAGNSKIGKDVNIERDLGRLLSALKSAEGIMVSIAQCPKVRTPS